MVLDSLLTYQRHLVRGVCVNSSKAIMKRVLPIYKICNTKMIDNLWMCT